MATNDGSGLGSEMDTTEIDEFLHEQGEGVLSLANHGEAYGVPVSFGYDGEAAFMYLIQFGEGSKKLAFSEGTDRACLTVFDAETRSKWTSVVAYGTLTAIPDNELLHMEEVMDDNGWFPRFPARLGDH